MRVDVLYMWVYSTLAVVCVSLCVFLSLQSLWGLFMLWPSVIFVLYALGYTVDQYVPRPCSTP